MAATIFVVVVVVAQLADVERMREIVVGCENARVERLIGDGGRWVRSRSSSSSKRPLDTLLASVTSWTLLAIGAELERARPIRLHISHHLVVVAVSADVEQTGRRAALPLVCLRQGNSSSGILGRRRLGFASTSTSAVWPEHREHVDHTSLEELLERLGLAYQRRELCIQRLLALASQLRIVAERDEHGPAIARPQRWPRSRIAI